MYAQIPDPPFMALIDDDDHSAYLLTRMLAAHDAPAIRHFASGAAGEEALAAILASPGVTWPGLVLIDLKAHSGANLEFVVRNHAMLRQKGIPLAVMSAPIDQAGRQALHDAGAANVFFRQAELVAYRHEAAAIVSFWARHQCLDAVGM
ncbi:hypothetical protein O9Z70_10415 [Devosia sp. YIM 151766]|uniref:hypothetical protein n=1 Tax=Devosia sp. YIM 151766 TaxID=3017325 RepID=UPI00255CC780|nr:hypothetical protein [Devosia sp. YIM 151766]WIY51895.1 hypothetical protein O9Z70_10415 [Devosia sp. YIM 151766]